MESQVRRKLWAILPRLEGANRVQRHTDTVLYNIYSYGHEAALLLAALGLSHPLVQFVAPDSTSSDSSSTAASTVISSIGNYPLWLLLLTCAFLVFWLLTRVTINQRKLGDKVPLYKACRRELGKVESDLDHALSSADPLLGLTDLQNRVKDIVDNYYAADGWPWPIEPPLRKSIIEERIEAYCVRYRESWAPLPRDVQQDETLLSAPGASR
jgi:hypothetical protein